VIDGNDLKRFAPFSEFSDAEREALADLLDVRRLPDGKSAFREGAESEGLVLLASGSLRLKSRRTGAVLGVLEAPAHLGGASLFAFGQREITAVAEGPTTVLILSRGALPRLVDEAPRAAYRLAEAVAAELAGLMRVSLDTLAEHDPESAD
jgi:CRP-like cAMP-binding protein